MKKEKLIELLKENDIYLSLSDSQRNDISELVIIFLAQTKSLIESQSKDLLIGFINHYNKGRVYVSHLTENDIERYLKSINK